MSTPRNELHVDPREAHDHGYWGRKTDPTDPVAYTVAGQTGNAPQLSDKPLSAPPESRPRTRAAKTTGSKPPVEVA